MLIKCFNNFLKINDITCMKKRGKEHYHIKAFTSFFEEKLFSTKILIKTTKFFEFVGFKL